jgi:hypothetical protein
MPATFTIDRDSVGPLLTRLASRLTLEARGGLVLAWGRAVAVQAQRNARAKGGRRFWGELARSVNVRRVDGGAAEVYSDHVAAAQKQYGGPIEAPGRGPGAKGAKALTIPLPGTPAEGRTAADFGGKLFLVKPEDEGGLLCANIGGEFMALFAVRKRTKPQPPSPFFPDAGAVRDVGEEMAKRRLEA